MSEALPDERTSVGPPSDASDDIPANPFSTRYVRPGALPFVFRAGEDADTLVARLRAHQWWGEIIGPHGSGKSTLLSTFAPELARAGRKPLVITCADGERSLAAHCAVLQEAHGSTVPIVDGYEQLAFWNKWRLRRYCRRRGCGLLVTAHAPVGLPPLATTTVDLDIATAVLRLLAPEAAAVTREELAQALATHAGNMRDALFDLYDLYEMRRWTI